MFHWKRALIFTALLIVFAGCSMVAQNTPTGEGNQAIATMPVMPTTAPTAVAPTAVLPTEAAPTEAAPTKAAPTKAATTEAAEPWIAYQGEDNNIWLVNPGSGAMQQVTSDATPMSTPTGSEIVQYAPPQWSSDGQLLAFERGQGTPVTEGLRYEFNLLVYDLTSGQTRVVVQNQQAIGYTWRPGTHLLTYGLPVSNDYFIARGQNRESAAAGIWAVDADSGAASELVKPEGGFSLVNPRWSSDGKRVGFEEIAMMEGRGNFAYYDFDAQKYVAWGKAVGNYQWSPDGQSLVYDYMVYIPSGQERIVANNFANTAEKQVSPADLGDSYAYGPAISPDGTQVAYFTSPLREDPSPASRLYVARLSGGDPLALGDFVQGGDLAWSADGQRLLLASGVYYENRQLVILTLQGETRVLVKGTFPTWQPRQQ